MSPKDSPPAEMASYDVYWFRSTIFQIFVVGGVFFCVRAYLLTFGNDSLHSRRRECTMPSAHWAPVDWLHRGMLMQPPQRGMVSNPSRLVGIAIIKISISFHGLPLCHWRRHRQ
jgi:hypothetical protein